MTLVGVRRLEGWRKPWARSPRNPNQFEVYLVVTLFIVLKFFFQFQCFAAEIMFESNLHTLTDGTDNPMSGEFRKVEWALN
jgi:hypothetical protein